MNKHTAFMLIILVVLSGFAWASKEWDDIAFTVNGTDIPIKVLTPDKGSGPFPVIYHVHGGGWNGGTQTEVPPAGLPPESVFFADVPG
jgi:hypothetical protein